ncbi:hypothetical protein AB0H34_09380 [Saccharopolyspora shandongensis]|uniref:hypothetical protein n=1 Tax=Saccharopolyspora shandongensis TaxID=418495 RepID=UPI0033D68E9C
MAAAKHRRTGIIAAGYTVSWTGDLAAEPPTASLSTLPEIADIDPPTLADEKALDAERAAAKRVARSRPRVTWKLLADVLAGLQRL